MRKRGFKLSLAAAGVAVTTAVPLMSQAAYADYAPNPNDVVGVGSDTLQYMIDFLATTDGYGNPGYAQQNNQYNMVSIDATADFNARLAYGNYGGVASTPGTAPCAPGTGSFAGTGNQTATNVGDFPCVLNPTVVLRAGKLAVQRPNGSGAGFKALLQDALNNHNTFPNGNEQINFSRASSAQSLPSTWTGPTIDQITIASDPLPIVTSSTHQDTAGKTTDFPLSPNQLFTIYNTSGTIGTGGSGPAEGAGCITWNDPRISGTIDPGVSFANGDTSITIPSGDTVPPSATAGTVSGPGVPAGTTVASISGQTVNLNFTSPATGLSGPQSNVTIAFSNTSASADQIIPIIPQVGSGTRSYFEGQTNPHLTDGTIGTCVIVGEENDPTAIRQASTPVDAIEPMSLGRFYLYQGNRNSASGPVSGNLNTVGGGYFLDPSCPTENPAGATNTGNGQSATCGTGTVGGTPAFKPQSEGVSDAAPQTTGTPLGTGAGTGTGTGLFQPTRNLFIYVRKTDLDSATPWQPGATDNWVQELFFSLNPSITPWLQQDPQALYDAGVVPLASPTCIQLVTSGTPPVCS